MGRIPQKVAPVPFLPDEHLVLAIGYDITTPGLILCIDPQDGNYRSIMFSEFIGNCLYEIKKTYTYE